MDRAGSYSSSNTNDFAIHVYDSEWGCVKSSSGDPIGPQRACPPLAPLTKETLMATTFGQWATITSEQARVYVLRVRFSPPGGSFKRDLRLTVRVTSASAPPLCQAQQQSG